ncbi:MAG TPA: lamin tail domain-containing protein [Blastocatellia bacterium]|nr:lamin tail domain-containing protein [Blastocatellia bacterium]
MANHLVHSVIALLAFVLFALAVSIRLSPPSSAFVSSGVVINEFRTNGPNGADDEFIELVNGSDSVVNVHGWQVIVLNGFTESTRIPVPSISLPLGAHLLLSGPRYSGAAKGDWLYNQGIADNCSIRLWDAAGLVVDAVSTEVGFSEEGGTLPIIDRNEDWSYERVRDTDHNDQDFRLISPSHPRSIRDAPLSATATATPAVVSPGDPLLLTVKVTSPPPLSTGLIAFCALDSLGGNGGQLLFDDGSHGDAVPGDRIFSCQITVPFGTELGIKTLTACAADKQNRSTCAIIVFDVGVVTPGPGCLSERFRVKTGTDPDVSRVALFSTPTPSTVASIRRPGTPQAITENSRVSPFETTVWIVSARLTAFKTEDDSAYRLILEDANGESMVVRIPCPCCVASGSPFRFRTAAARAKFDQLFSATDTLQSASEPVFVEGVGFYDSVSDQTGAQSRAGLYPVLNIDFNIDPLKPRIISASVSGKKLVVFGLNFDQGARIFIESQKQKTTNDASEPRTSLVSKKAGKTIERGQEVTLTVKNANGSVSDGFTFRRPS